MSPSLKSRVLLGFCVLVTFSCQLQAKKVTGGLSDFERLKGKWSGLVITNSKDPLGGGNPTLGETGTPISIELSQSTHGLSGSMLVGQVKEEWEFFEDFYVWTDFGITVTTKRIKLSQTPDWILKKLEGENKNNTFVYKFEKCRVNNTSESCSVPKDLPEGVNPNGFWVFKVDGHQLLVNVYYEYTTGGRRILEQVLNKR